MRLIIANSYYKALLGRFGMSLISLTQKQLIPEYWDQELWYESLLFSLSNALIIANAAARAEVLPLFLVHPFRMATDLLMISGPPIYLYTFRVFAIIVAELQKPLWNIWVFIWSLTLRKRHRQAKNFNFGGAFYNATKYPKCRIRWSHRGGAPIPAGSHPVKEQQRISLDHICHQCTRIISDWNHCFFGAEECSIEPSYGTVLESGHLWGIHHVLHILSGVLPALFIRKDRHCGCLHVGKLRVWNSCSLVCRGTGQMTN